MRGTYEMADAFLKEYVKQVRLPPQMRLRYSKMEPPVDRFDYIHRLELDGRWDDAHGRLTQVITHTTIHLSDLRYIEVELWDQYVDGIVTRAVRHLWDHELNEWFLIRGKHVREPHNLDGSFT